MSSHPSYLVSLPKGCLYLCKEFIDTFVRLSVFIRFNFTPFLSIGCGVVGKTLKQNAYDPCQCNQFGFFNSSYLCRG